MSDPWRHLSRHMKCATCMWFVQKHPEPILMYEEKNKNMTEVSEDAVRPVFGRCRKRAPEMEGYPAVYGIDWCGDHKLDENKA